MFVLETLLAIYIAFQVVGGNQVGLNGDNQVGLNDGNHVVLIDCKNINQIYKLTIPQYTKQGKKIKLKWMSNLLKDTQYETCLVNALVTQWFQQENQNIVVLKKISLSTENKLVNVDIDPCFNNNINITYNFKNNFTQIKHISFPKNEKYRCTNQTEYRRGKRALEGACFEGVPHLGVQFEMSRDKLKITKKDLNKLEISWSHLISQHLECVDQVRLYKFPDTQNPIDERKLSMGGQVEKRPFTVSLNGDEICWKQKFFIVAINDLVNGKDEKKSETVEYTPKVENYFNDKSELKLENTEKSIKIFLMTNLLSDWNYKRCLTRVIITLNDLTTTVYNAHSFGNDSFKEFALDTCIQSTLNIAYSFQINRNGILQTKHKRAPIAKQTDCQRSATFEIIRNTTETTKIQPECVKEDNFDYAGGDLSFSYGYADTETADSCAAVCARTEDCKFWTFGKYGHECWMKHENKGRRSNQQVISGNKACGKDQQTTHLEPNPLRCPNHSTLSHLSFGLGVFAVIITFI